MRWQTPDRRGAIADPNTDTGSRLRPAPPGAVARQLDPYVAPAMPTAPRTYRVGRTCSTCPAHLSIYNPAKHCGACRCADKDVTP